MRVDTRYHIRQVAMYLHKDMSDNTDNITCVFVRQKSRVAGQSFFSVQLILISPLVVHPQLLLEHLRLISAISPLLFIKKLFFKTPDCSLNFLTSLKNILQWKILLEVVNTWEHLQ